MTVHFDASAVFANRHLGIHMMEQGRAMTRLATGFRINSASDDPSGLALSQHMQAQMRGLDRANRNAQEGISLLQVAEAGASEIANMIQRIREILVQAANEMLTENEQRMQQEEIDQLTHDIGRISATTRFNTMPLLTGDLNHLQRLTPEVMPPMPHAHAIQNVEMEAISPISASMPLYNVVIDINAIMEGYSGNGWNFANGTLHITGDNSFRIVGGTTVNRRIDVSSNDATIILDNVQLDTNLGDAMTIGSANVTLWLEGHNLLRSSATALPIGGEGGGAGIGISSGNLIIEGTGSLTAAASQYGISNAYAGIGSGRAANLGGLNSSDLFTGSVTIRGGYVRAYGGSLGPNGDASGGGGAGIGGAHNRATDGASLIVEGGRLVATGGTGAAGIGGGAGLGVLNAGRGIDVHVTGGRVDAYGGAAIRTPGVNYGFGGAAIGAGARSAGTGSHGGSLTIDGGIVNVTSGARSAAVGGAGASANSSGANVLITSGLLEVHRGWIGGSTTATNQGNTIVQGGNLSIHYSTGSNTRYYIDRSNVAAIDEHNNPTGAPAFRVQIFLNDANHAFTPFDELTYHIGGRQITGTVDSQGRLFFYLPADASDNFGGQGLMVVNRNGQDINYTGQFTINDPHGHNNMLILTPENVPPPPPPPSNDDVFLRPSRPHTPGTPMVFQVGANSNQLMFQHIGALTLETLGLRDAQGNNTIDVMDRSAFAISQMISFIDNVNHSVVAEIAHLSASQNRLHHITNQLDNSYLTHSDTHSHITDADFAREQSRNTRYDLLRQAATVMMAQAVRSRHDSVHSLINQEIPQIERPSTEPPSFNLVDER